MIEKIINNVIKEFIVENIQQADKIYFNTGKLSDEDRKLILSVTNGDNYTKIISDIYFTLKDYWFMFDKNKDVQIIYNTLKNYNNNVVPIEGFNNINNYSISIVDLYYALLIRNKILLELKKISHIGIRNIKSDITKKRDYNSLKIFLNELEYLTVLLSLLDNKDEELKTKILNKAFKNNSTVSSVIDFFEDKQNLLSDENISIDEVLELIESDYDMFLLYNKNNVIVVRIETLEALKKIGCNSLWCTTYGGANYHTWNTYSHNDMVYIIMDFNQSPSSSDFMYIVIKPIKFKKGYNYEYHDDYPIFDSHNEPYYQPYDLVNNLFGIKLAKQLFTFEY